MVVLAIIVIGVSGILVLRRTESPNESVTYEWFEQQYEEIQAIDREIIDIECYMGSLGPQTTLAEWSEADKDEHDHLNSLLVEQTRQLKDAVNRYNSRSDAINPNWVELPRKIEVKEFDEYSMGETRI